MKNEKKIYFYLLGFSTFLYIAGYFFNENSAGGGSYFGDIKLIWNNLQIFQNNPLRESISHEEYIAGRTPIAYLLHIYLNPFLDDLESFRLSVFIISFMVPILLIITINLENKNSKYYISSYFIVSLLLLSPYFRTSSYWALEENYGLIFLIFSYLSLFNLIKKKNNIHKTKNIFFLCLLVVLLFILIKNL